MNTQKEQLVEIINKRALPFCDEVYELADDILKWHKQRVKNLNIPAVSNNEVVVCCDTCVYNGEDYPCKYGCTKKPYSEWKAAN